MAPTRFEILDPTVPALVEGTQLAQRPDSLNGKVVGLYANGKLNARRLLDLVSEQLNERYQIKEFVEGDYSASRLMKPDEWGDIERCDAVILGLGD